MGRAEAFAMKNNVFSSFLDGLGNSLGYGGILLIVAFLSKQVPAAYVILFVCFVLLLYILINKRFYFIKYSYNLLSHFVFFVDISLFPS